MVTWKAYDRKMQELERFQDRQEQLMWNLLARLCNQKMAQGFETWIILTNELRRHELILERAARRMQNRKLNGSFRGWVVYVKTRKYNLFLSFLHCKSYIIFIENNYGVK